MKKFDNESEQAWETLMGIHDDQLDKRYDDGYLSGVEDTLRTVRDEVGGKTYTRAVRTLLTKLKKEFLGSDR